MPALQARMPALIAACDFGLVAVVQQVHEHLEFWNCILLRLLYPGASAASMNPGMSSRRDHAFESIQLRTMRTATMKSLGIAPALLLILGMNAQAQVTSIVDLSPLYKDTVANSPGIEMIHPYLDFVDDDTDGVMDSLIVRFDVYPADSSSRLFGTTIRKVDFPVPCVNPDDFSWAEVTSIRFLGTDASRSHLAIGLAGGCYETDPPFDYKEGYRTFVYSAAVDGSSGPVWVKTYNLEMMSFESVDVDGDTTKEVVLGLVINLANLPDDASNLRSIALEGADGTQVFNVSRPLTR